MAIHLCAINSFDTVPLPSASGMEQSSANCCRIDHRMDFQQGLIATIHDYGLGKLDLPDFRRQLRQRPTSLLIPCLMEEFSRPALGLIREVLAELSGLEELVIALSAETSDDVAAAEAFFSDMPFPVRVHWTNGPAVAESLQSLQSLGLNVTGPPGKGLGCVAGAWCGLQER
jgi:glucosyl-3-phosphoglycerate synthase